MVAPKIGKVKQLYAKMLKMMFVAKYGMKAGKPGMVVHFNISPATGEVD